MRTKLSLINAICSYAASFVAMIVGFIAQAIFLKTLNEAYAGVNGLFNNIVSMLSIVEAGVGAAIAYNLYKPIARKDIGIIKSLMLFYKVAYRKIAVIFFLAGLCVIPFLPLFINADAIPENIVLIYIIFLVDAATFYLISYKRTILIANFENYYINVIHIGYLVLVNSLQIFILYKFKNYYLYLAIKLLMRILENVVINIIANKKYPYLLENNAKKLDSKIAADIKQKIKALLFHKVGTFIVSGTDNILISAMFGISYVGLYSNYFMIINTVSSLLNQAFNSITSLVGNLIVLAEKKHQLKVYNNLHFINFWVATFTSTAILLIMEPFIKIWIGEEYLLSTSILFVLVLNYYFTSMRVIFNLFKDAAGIYYEDRFVPLLESVCNIVLSIIFGKLFGLVGIFIGTLSSQFILHFYSYPKYVCKKIFDMDYKRYYMQFAKYFITFVLCAGISYLVSMNIQVQNLFLEIFAKAVVAVVVPNLMIVVLYRKSSEYAYLKNVAARFFRKVKNKILSRWRRCT